MIATIEALNYRCLRYVRQDVGAFQVLVGPNASGKSAFLDTVAFLGDLLKGDVERAVRERSSDPRALFWMGQGNAFEIAVEFVIPEDRRREPFQNNYPRARYEVSVGFNAAGELAILSENLRLTPDPDKTSAGAQLSLFFPDPIPPPQYIVFPAGKSAPPEWKKVVTRRAAGNVYFMSETSRWNNPFRLGEQKSALAILPEDEKLFPVATWVKRTLMEGIQRLALNSEAMRRPAPPGSPLDFRPDGSNLPRVIEEFSRRSPERFARWVAHVRTGLRELKSIETIERPEDRHRYIRLINQTGFQAPSWVVSDGTLRLLALTLLAYLEGPPRTYLIEEPENGIHPLAIETVFQALESAYDAQVLCASHSPVLLSLAQPEQLLCFAKTEEGATDIRRGSEHPMLGDWKHSADLGTLFASGVLG